MRARTIKIGRKTIQRHLGPAPACPLGRRVHCLNILQYMNIAGNSERLRDRTHAPTQAVAALISKWEQRYSKDFEMLFISGLHGVLPNFLIRFPN